jgi:MFS superfamily sulfate permease-like transporter
VFRISFLLYLVLLVVVLIACAILWAVGLASGTLEGVNHFVKSLFGYQSFSIFWPEAFLGIALTGLILAFLGALANAFVAVLYNRLSSRVGGVVVVTEEDRGRRVG